MLGWGNSGTASGLICDVCAPGWFPEGKCNIQCLDDKVAGGCGGKGTCNAQGTCECQPGYGGNYCTRCMEGNGFPDAAHAGQCKYCDPVKTCNGKGVCNSAAQCVCATGFTGSNCTYCAPPYTTNQPTLWPACPGAVAASSTTGGTGAGATGGAAAIGGAAPAANTCGVDYWWPILLAILGTLLVMGILFFIWKKRQQNQAGESSTAKSGNWQGFESESSTAYSQL